MHDGRFATLEDVINFYSEEKQQHANLDFRLTSNYVTGGLPLHFNFTDAEKLALIAFLKTLTDWDLVGDVKYADPFL
jgi:cytochrome c peroxidase